MSFDGYLRSIQDKTGRDSAGLRKWADEQGLADGGRLSPGVKVGDVVARAKADLGLGHGHAMAVSALLSGKRSKEQ